MPEQNEIDQSGLAAAFEAARNPQPVAEAVVADAPVVVETPVVETPAPTSAPDTKQFNPSEWLKESTEGLIDSEERFKEFIPKIKGYDDLETKLKAAEANKIEFTNDETKQLYELWAAGDKKAVRDYIAETERDYNVMSDLDVIRTDIAKKHPEWDSKGIELEVRGVYGKQLNPVDLTTIEETDEDGKITQEYKDALAHNEKVEENAIRIQRDARDFRAQLIDKQSKIQLPEIKKAEATTPATNAPSEQDVQRITDAYLKDVQEKLPELKGIKQTINDKEVEYSFTDTEKSELSAYMKDFNIFKFANERGWYNADGTTNVVTLAQDVQKLLKFDTISSSFGSQIATATKKDVLKDIKNISDPARPALADTEPDSLGDAYMRARQEAGWTQ